MDSLLHARCLPSPALALVIGGRDEVLVIRADRAVELHDQSGVPTAEPVYVLRDVDWACSAGAPRRLLVCRGAEAQVLDVRDGGEVLLDTLELPAGIVPVRGLWPLLDGAWALDAVLAWGGPETHAAVLDLDTGSVLDLGNGWDPARFATAPDHYLDDTSEIYGTRRGEDVVVNIGSGDVTAEPPARRAEHELSIRTRDSMDQRWPARRAMHMILGRGPYGMELMAGRLLTVGPNERFIQEEAVLARAPPVAEELADLFCGADPDAAILADPMRFRELKPIGLSQWASDRLLALSRAAAARGAARARARAPSAAVADAPPPPPPPPRVVRDGGLRCRGRLPVDTIVAAYPGKPRCAVVVGRTDGVLQAWISRDGGCAWDAALEGTPLSPSAAAVGINATGRVHLITAAGDLVDAETRSVVLAAARGGRAILPYAVRVHPLGPEDALVVWNAGHGALAAARAAHGNTIRDDVLGLPDRTLTSIVPLNPHLVVVGTTRIGDAEESLAEAAGELMLVELAPTRRASAPATIRARVPTRGIVVSLAPVHDGMHHEILAVELDGRVTWRAWDTLAALRGGPPTQPVAAAVAAATVGGVQLDAAVRAAWADPRAPRARALVLHANGALVRVIADEGLQMQAFVPRVARAPARTAAFHALVPLCGGGLGMQFGPLNMVDVSEDDRGLERPLLEDVWIGGRYEAARVRPDGAYAVVQCARPRGGP